MVFAVFFMLILVALTVAKTKVVNTMFARQRARPAWLPGEKLTRHNEMGVCASLLGVSALFDTTPWLVVSIFMSLWLNFNLLYVFWYVWGKPEHDQAERLDAVDEAGS